MQPKDHANLLSIFSWVYAAMQAMILIVFLLYIVLMGGFAIVAAANARGDEAFGLLLWGVMILFIAILAAVGLVSFIANIRLGIKLRGNEPPSQRSVIITAILNFLSFLCGGIMLLPFGTALGVYGLWFALSESGKHFLSGRPYIPEFAYPQPPQVAQINSYDNTPYKWQ